MVQKITWLAGAQKSFADAIVYLEQNFTEKEVNQFTRRVQQKLLVLKANPGLGVKSAKAFNIYKTVVLKKIILVYRYKPFKKEIELIVFWNTQQNPRKMKF